MALNHSVLFGWGVLFVVRERQCCAGVDRWAVTVAVAVAVAVAVSRRVLF